MPSDCPALGMPRRLTHTGRVVAIAPAIVLAVLLLLATCGTPYGVPGW